MIYYVSIRAHVLDDKSSETDVFCDFGLSTKNFSSYVCVTVKSHILSFKHYLKY